MARTRIAQKATLPERLVGKTDVRTYGECWNWMGYVRASGYPTITVTATPDRKAYTLYAYRLSYELNVGPIPAGYQIDHLCRNRRCVNPLHLEAVEPVVNNQRSNSVSARNYRKTHCLHGHEYTPTNTFVYGGKRRCRECSRLRCSAYRYAQKAAA